MRFLPEITEALGSAPPTPEPLIEGSEALTSVFDVAGLATASIGAAAAELAALTGAPRPVIDGRLAQKWFDMTLRPIGWELPSPWDAVAGDYATRDGWIRLHTNAPHHRAAALRVLGCAADRPSVAKVAATWNSSDLEDAVVAAGGCAAAMRSSEAWLSHPQGAAVAAEPLIAWTDYPTAAPRPASLPQIRVLDLTRVLAGPVATRFLAGFGADVLRIDPPDWDEPGVVPEVTLGKRCAGLDLRQKQDRAIFEALLKGADLLFHGYRPGALAGLGYDAGKLRSLNPALIEISLSAYGWSGPWAGRRGFDSLVQMSSGIASEGMARFNTDRPRPLPVQALDHATGYLMAAAALRALGHRAKSGQILSARLSLARTAHLLISAGPQSPAPGLTPESDADLAPGIEATAWGPARRVAFPVSFGGGGPTWPYPAGPLRTSPPRWRDQD